MSSPPSSVSGLTVPGDRPDLTLPSSRLGERILSLSFPLDPLMLEDGLFLYAMNQPETKKTEFVYKLFLPFVAGGVLTLTMLEHSLTARILTGAATTLALSSSFILYFRPNAIRKRISAAYTKMHHGLNQPTNAVGFREITFHQNGLRIRTSEIYTESQWKGMPKMAIHPEYFFLFETPVNFHLIPRSQLSPEEDQTIQHFLAQTLASLLSIETWTR
jgi:hypothetical protein